ncbi:hypothetical protein ACH43Y_28835 [Streptomyces rubiginosohelvolus]|uniref:hypothetical protein n=1 Tax=Streptomyces TaxID=1883 RepID=UPI000B5C826F|nr:hypothetical protein [Streptomyces sp. SS07]
MTAFLRAFVYCDGCNEPMDNSTVPSARNISEALREAKSYGWSRKRGRLDLCPHCRTARTRAPEETQ